MGEQYEAMSTEVSTHSRLKAAGKMYVRQYPYIVCFNTQPPEGGWAYQTKRIKKMTVSTHSRPKAAG